jgi:hypothetical protein
VSQLVSNVFGTSRKYASPPEGLDWMDDALCLGAVLVLGPRIHELLSRSGHYRSE